MGNLYRFVDPVALFLLKRKGRSYEYELANDLGRTRGDTWNTRVSERPPGARPPEHKK